MGFVWREPANCVTLIREAAVIPVITMHSAEEKHLSLKLKWSHSVKQMDAFQQRSRENDDATLLYSCKMQKDREGKKGQSEVSLRSLFFPPKFLSFIMFAISDPPPPPGGYASAALRRAQLEKEAACHFCELATVERRGNMT